MNLMTVQKVAQEIAVSISEIMNVDVVIVDDQLNRVADTFRYPYSSIEVRSSSIIGRILKTGQPLIVDNKDFFPSCMDCRDRGWCRMQGLMGVPIMANGQTVGAIGLVVEQSNVRHLVENTNLVLTFLQQMADHLSGKLIWQESYDSLQKISSQWECIINTVDACVVLLDGLHRIIVQNERFQRLFGHGENCCDHLLTEYISHPVVDRILSERLEAAGKSLVLPMEDGVFCGVIHVRQIWQNGVFQGTVFSIQELAGSVHEDTSAFGMEEFPDTLSSLVTDREILGELESVNRSRTGWVLLRGNRLQEPYLRRVALAIHMASGRPGKFVYVRSRDWYGTNLEPVAFDLTDLNQIPSSIMLAHQGTLCIHHIFDLPVCQQERIMAYLRGGRDRRQGSGFVTKLIFLENEILPSEDSPYVCGELFRLLAGGMIELPNPTHTHRQMRRRLEKCFRMYARSCGIGEPEIEEEVWDILGEYPWDTCRQPMHKVVEQLVCAHGGKVRTADADSVLRKLDLESRSVRNFEQEQIVQLMGDGLPLEQIANLLKISRSTLYRRIKKYGL